MKYCKINLINCYENYELKWKSVYDIVLSKK